jgi:hypothetical protein
VSGAHRSPDRAARRRSPDRDGAKVLEQLDKEVGDTVRLESQDSPGGESPVVTIVGVAAPPSVEILGVDSTRLSRWDRRHAGRGQYVQLAESGPSTAAAPDITWFDLADGVDPADVIARYPGGVPGRTGFIPTEWLTSLAPAEVIGGGNATTALAAPIIGLPADVVVGRRTWPSFALGFGLVDARARGVPLAIVVRRVRRVRRVRCRRRRRRVGAIVAHRATVALADPATRVMQRVSP